MMDSSQSFGALRETIQSALVTVTRSVNGLANEDLQFQRTVDPAVANKLDDKTDRLLRLASDLLASAGKATGQKVSTLEDVDDVDIQWKGIVDVIDSLLEKADTCLDEYTGLIKRKNLPVDESGRDSKRPKSTHERLDQSLKRANILKPQNAFQKKIDNFEPGPWKPLLTKKPHAVVPLGESLSTFTDEEQNKTEYEDQVSSNFILGPARAASSMGVSKHCGEGGAGVVEEPKLQQEKNKMEKNKNTNSSRRRANYLLRYKHPYETEIRFMQYPKQVYQQQEAQEYLPVETTSAIWVDTYEGVLEMIEELKKAKEIALDLEHHDYRSYTGLLSLMQISTRDKDWIVDTLVPWRHKLEILNEVFADPGIIKVLHGAFMDIIWLQRDLGLYVVGLFDTHHACGVLGYPGKSLAYLLKKFVDFDADKRYQLADWRIRPLPEEMFYYAQSDTHYLLYIFDMVRNELVGGSGLSDPEKNLVELVIQKSKDVSLQRYESPVYDSETGLGPRGWFNTLVKSPTLYNGEQFSVYKAVHKWRDDLARHDDESPFFIMTQQVLGDIARILPSDKKALWSLLDSNAKGLKVHFDGLFELIQAAQASGVNGPSVIEFFRAAPGATAQNSLDSVPTKTIPESDHKSTNIQDLRAQHSQLWGNMAMSTLWDGSTKANESDEILEISLPYHRFVEGTCAVGSGEEIQKAASDSASSNPHQTQPEVQVLEDQNFTLKGGRKRKNIDDATDSELDGQSDAGSEPDSEIRSGNVSGSVKSPPQDGIKDNDLSGDRSHSNETAAAKESRAEKKARKKQARKLAKIESREQARATWKTERRAKKAAMRAAQQAQPAGAMDEDGDERPFDYSKAAPVLQTASKLSAGDKKGGKFDPYTKKSGDGPRGARQLNYEKSGRTATFKK
ncbi:ribonuclease H-like domain-containing protein [Lasiosphaeria miniovina]|uniref:Ribonuclease H-like domain-containing protein n=1 Tax=Lasiosphaeria miniovina TaxID=1954250 RepID=A0AA40ACD9_9PEZI|nr:ribonuclease H-like domain-containing protein [Lasiosphaeria miniovina]KAK0713113.1 ribonuclease H-like domain-containing protein [Lasiosphaeria miniovina]